MTSSRRRQAEAILERLEPPTRHSDVVVNLPSFTPAGDLRPGDEFTHGPRYYKARKVTDCSEVLGLDMIAVRTDTGEVVLGRDEIIAVEPSRRRDAEEILARLNERTH